MTKNFTRRRGNPSKLLHKIKIANLRRVVVAELQHITYNEWLPIVLGTNFMDSLDILPLTHGHNTKYNPKINPNILNSFSTAAFRFGHSLIQGLME